MAKAAVPVRRSNPSLTQAQAELLVLETDDLARRTIEEATLDPTVAAMPFEKAIAELRRRNYDELAERAEALLADA